MVLPSFGEVLEKPVADLSEMGLSGRQMVLENHDALVEARKLAKLPRPYVDEGSGTT